MNSASVEERLLCLVSEIAIHTDPPAKVNIKPVVDCPVSKLPL